MSFAEKVKSGFSKVSTYWKTPMAGRYMTFREIAAYSGGGIGAYMIITLGIACLLATGNTLITSTLGVDATDMYIMYVIAVLANIPLTGIRATIIDNTRNKAGKYRPYIVTMAVPTAVICIIMVWFPYNSLESIVGPGMIFGETKAYVAKCAIIMVLNLLLHFFYYFFYDAYENLIHVLSPNSQERADVASVKSVVYSLAPTIVNLLTPIIASNLFHTNSTDIRVYRFLYPILAVLGILLCMVVYKYTEEKIVQARTHIVQIKFSDAFREVAKNKYFWIISLASWVGFLESAYANILFWLYNYGGACSGNVYGLVVTVYGNASLWGMLLAPLCVRKWGKKSVLVVTNIFNVIFILMMMPFTAEITNLTIWLVMGCLYLNAFMSSFMLILNPAIQADIRDYQQYKTGERIDGMFSAVATIGTIITLVTSSILPAIYEKGGITKHNAAVVTSNPAILDRMLGDGKTVGTLLAEQLANGQDNYNNAFSALYDPEILIPLLHVLIIVSAVGALMNVIPYIWYDFNEIKQKSVVRVLQVRALFEDYGNGVLDDGKLVSTIDLIREARITSVKEHTKPDKKSYKSVKDKAERKAAKKAYYEEKHMNDEIEISKFVCDELDKFSKPGMQKKLQISTAVYKHGLKGLLDNRMEDLKKEKAEAKKMSKATAEEKELRSFCIDMANKRITSRKALDKHFSDVKEFVQPDFAVLEKLFDREDDLEDKVKGLYTDLQIVKKAHDAAKVRELKAEIKTTNAALKEAREASKKEMDKHAYFNRAAKPYLDSEKLIKQNENYNHFEEIASQYEDAKLRHEKAVAEEKAEQERLKAEEDAINAKIKAEKASKKKKK